MGSSSRSNRITPGRVPGGTLVENTLVSVLELFPSTIERITVANRPFIQKFAIWADGTKHVWDGWWDQTPWRTENPTAKITWDHSKKRSEKWTNFRSLSRVSDGRPFVQCLRCDYVLQHPVLEQSGTSVLGRHVNSQQCKKSAKVQGLPPLADFLKRKSVRLLQ